MATILSTLVTNRTQRDVDRAYYLESLWKYDKKSGKLVWKGNTSEYNEWLNDPKGEYRYTTLNRVESAIGYVRDLLSKAGYEVQDIEVKTDWKMEDIPIIDHADRIISNLNKIRNTVRIPYDTPEVPCDLDMLTFEEANDIEKIILYVGEAAERLRTT